MRANFIKLLCEASIETTELALCIDKISGDFQSMIEKLTNIKTKDVAELTKKIKFGGEIDAGEQFNQMISEKLDQAIQTLTDVKSSIDNEVVNISQGKSFGQGGEPSPEQLGSDLENSDFASDFGDDFEEFDPNEEPEEDFDLDVEELDRERK